MDPRKAALKEFLDFARNSLESHTNKAVEEGKLSANEAKKSLDNFTERQEIVLRQFDKQVGGLPSMEKADMPSEEEIKKQIDKLINFDPSEHIPPAIQPILDNTLWVFIPNIRDTLKKAAGTVFLLGSIEQLPIFGPLIASSMDIASAFMPALATSFQNFLPKIMSLLPIPAPFAAIAGEAAGFAFSAVLMFMTMMTQAGRGEFSEALESAAGLVPVIGTTLMVYINKGKKIVSTVLDARKKIVVSLAQTRVLITMMIPIVTKNVAKMLQKLLPILNVVIQKAAVYAIKPANLVLSYVKPIVDSAKARLSKLEKVTAGGVRYTKKTRRKKRKQRKSKTRHSTI